MNEIEGNTIFLGFVLLLIIVAILLAVNRSHEFDSRIEACKHSGGVAVLSLDNEFACVQGK